MPAGVRRKRSKYQFSMKKMENDLEQKLVKAQKTILKLKSELQETHEELQKTNSELLMLTLEMDERVEERTRALQRSEKELIRHRNHLQELVEERTVDLKNLNRELKYKIGELQASEERFRSLVVTIPDIVYRIDTEGHFTFVNEAIQRMGYAPEELLGKHFSKIIHPADVQKISRSLVLPGYKGRVTGSDNAPKLFDERRTGNRKTTGLEVNLVMKNRIVKPGIVKAVGKELVAVEINSAGMYEVDSNINAKAFIGSVGVIRDISERKQIEMALVESQKRARTILDCTEAGIVLIDPETHTIVDANPSAIKMIGASDKEDVVGFECHQFFCPAEKGKCPVSDLKQTIDRTERELINLDGNSVPILKTVVPIELEGKIHLLESFVDISLLKKTEEELKKARDELEIIVERRTRELRTANEALQDEIVERKRMEKKLQDLLEELKNSQAQLIHAEKIGALGVLTAGIAHELNNPLMGMLNFTQYCMKHTAEDDKRYAVLKDTLREILRCSEIVRNLLIFSRIEDVSAEDFRKGSLAAVFDRIFSLVAYRIEKENVNLVQRYSQDVPEIPMKTSNIQQVFLNLVDNALDAVKDKKTKEISVEVHPEGRFAKVTISDNGYGISPENRSKIFDPFFTTKPPGKGTGLGLSVSRSIVENHGGRIDCRSDAGKGTVFEILLPMERVTETGNSRRET
jgi:PAS domain S-box-containing protein